MYQNNMRCNAGGYLGPIFYLWNTIFTFSRKRDKDQTYLTAAKRNTNTQQMQFCLFASNYSRPLAVAQLDSLTGFHLYLTIRNEKFNYFLFQPAAFQLFRNRISGITEKYLTVQFSKMTNVTKEDAAYIAWTKMATTNYLRHATLIVTPYGLICNTLMALIFTRKRFNKNTMGFYYIVSI